MSILFEYAARGHFQQKLPKAAIGSNKTKAHFVLCGWLLLSKTFLVRFMFVRSGLVSGLFARITWPLALMVSTNQAPFCTSNSERSGQSTVYLGSRADNFSITSLVLLSLYFV
jgi:hypothetical protein